MSRLRHFLPILFIFCALGLSLSATDSKDTRIESQKLEMIGEDDQTIFVFTGSVKVTANNMTVTCNHLEVRTKKEGEGEYSFGKIGAIISITATESVEIRQAGRIATAGKAEVLPNEGRIVLTGNPLVRDRQGEVSGERIVLLRDQRRALVEGDKEGSRTRVRLGQLPDLGFQEGNPPVSSNASGEATTPSTSDSATSQP